MKVLIMGLSGAGKTHLSDIIYRRLTDHNKRTMWLNADNVRLFHNDWDFSEEGRIRQAQRLTTSANNANADIVICDSIMPLKKMRDMFAADLMIWVDTPSTCQYEDTNQMFEPPVSEPTIRIVDMSQIDNLVNIILTWETHGAILYSNRPND